MAGGRKAKRPCRRNVDESDNSESEDEAAFFSSKESATEDEEELNSTDTGVEKELAMASQDTADQDAQTVPNGTSGLPGSPWKARLRHREKMNYAKHFEVHVEETESDEERRRKEPSETELNAAAKIAATWTREEKHALLQMIMKLGAETKQYEAIASVIQTRTVQEIRYFMQKVIRKVVPEGRLAAPLEIWQKFVDGIVTKHHLPDSGFVAKVMEECAKETTPPSDGSPFSLNYSLLYRYIGALLDGSALPQLGVCERQAMLHLLDSLARRIKQLDKTAQEDYLIKNFFLRLPTTDAVVLAAQASKGRADKSRGKGKRKKAPKPPAATTSRSKASKLQADTTCADMPEIVRYDSIAGNSDDDIVVRECSSEPLPVPVRAESSVSVPAGQNLMTDSSLSNDMINVMNWSMSADDTTCNSPEADSADWVLPSSAALTQSTLAVFKLAGMTMDGAEEGTLNPVDGGMSVGSGANAGVGLLGKNKVPRKDSLPNEHPVVLSLNPLAIPASLLIVSQRDAEKRT